MTNDLIHHVVALGENSESTDEVFHELVGYLHHSDGNVRRLACSAIGKLKFKQAERPLITMLDDEKPQVRQYALKALTGCATPFSINALQRIISTGQEKEYNKASAKRILVRLQQLDKASHSVVTSSLTEAAPEVFLKTPQNLIKDLSIDQRNVIDALLTWIKKPHTDYITVGGYAGTGKTTITTILRTILQKEHPKLSIAFACFTGKASQVLKNKLMEQKAFFNFDSIGTLHSLMYQPRINGKGQVIGWSRVPQLETDLIIIDEASMVTRAMWQDIRSYGIPIIAIGDHGQLPPVGDEYSLMDKPHLRLEKIHRHALDNPILQIATLARTTGKIPYQAFSRTVKKIPKHTEEASEMIDHIFAAAHNETLILCGRNATRIKINQRVRQLKGITNDEPQREEQVICLKNNYLTVGGPIYNGMVGKLVDIKPNGVHWYDTEIFFKDEARTYQGKISRYQFHKERYLETVPGLNFRQIGDRFDFGYALTVHKSQGSQAKRVLLFEEKSPYWEGHLWNRWLYTAVTRAVEELYIVG